MIQAQDLRKRVQSEPAILIYFKNDNCAPCLVLRPKVKELIDEFFPNIEMMVVDSVEQPEFAGEFQVYANPTLLVFSMAKNISAEVSLWPFHSSKPRSAVFTK